MKKNEKRSTSEKTDSERETRVLLESISQQVQIVAEGHGTIIRKLDEHDKKFDGIKSELDTVKIAVMDTNQRIKAIEKKIDNHETRITKLEEKVVV